MTYYLTTAGLGIATDSTPVSAKSKVILTFEGDFADCVCVSGRFYPIVEGRAELPASAITSLTPVTAHALAERRRYICDPLGRIGVDGEMIAPVRDSGIEHLLTLAASVATLEKRLAAAEERLTLLSEQITRTPFHFGGIS